MSFLQEFKTFAVKGNAMDMAVGLVVGAAFTKIVNSLVNDLIMPPLGLMVGGVDFKNLRILLRAAHTGPAGESVPEVAIRYGAFLNTFLEFLIIAFSVFVVVKFMNRLIRQREQKTE